MNRKFLFTLEHHKQPLASKRVFLQRVMKCIYVSFLLVTVSILIGTVVYHYTEKLSWVDASMNSVMIMAGQGVTVTLTSIFGKIFTCFYAVITAIVFYMVLGMMFVPIIHRFLHKFHMEIEE